MIDRRPKPLSSAQPEGVPLCRHIVMFRESRVMDTGFVARYEFSTPNDIEPTYRSISEPRTGRDAIAARSTGLFAPVSYTALRWFFRYLP